MAKAYRKYWYACSQCGWRDTYEYSGKTAREAKLKAEKIGWKIGKEAVCTQCLEDKK
jgi:hypothetical protein